MAALRSRCGHYTFALWFLLSFFLSFFPRLISAVADWTSANTSTHDVALVRRSDAGLKRAARGSLKIQDAKTRQKIAIWALHNFVGLYLRN